MANEKMKNPFVNEQGGEKEYKLPAMLATALNTNRGSTFAKVYLNELAHLNRQNTEGWQAAVTFEAFENIVTLLGDLIDQRFELARKLKEQDELMEHASEQLESLKKTTTETHDMVRKALKGVN